MRGKTFKGGIHPPYNKQYSKDLPIEVLDGAKEMFYPLSQHIGAFAEPVVNVGDKVFCGQVIAKAGGFVSANIHSSVSGTVTAIKPYPHPNGTEVMTIVVENDGEYKVFEGIKPNKPLEQLTPAEIVDIVKEAGIVGMGGATFPTYIKLMPPKDGEVDCVIVNGAECEPYLTSDHRVLVENTRGVLDGLKIAMKALGVNKGYVAIEDNKPDAIEKMSECAKEYEGITVVPLKTKYPQGSEKHIIKAVTGRTVPSGGLPSSVGCVVINTDTANAINTAVTTGMPLISRIVTVGGDAVENNKNYKVRTGTPVSFIIESAGGFKKEPSKIILGGPMMGTAVSNTDVPIIKGTGAVLSFTEEALRETASSKCMRCGKCVEACPMFLQPLLLGAYGKKDDIEKMKELNVMDCIECGACSYLCPGHQNPLQYIRVAKLKIGKAGKK